MKCIIAGSRSFAPSSGDSLRVCGEKLRKIDSYIIRAVRESGFIITQVVSGRAKGIDVGGERWARRNGIPIEPFPVVWKVNGIYNPRAGYERDDEMVIYCEFGIFVWDG